MTGDQIDERMGHAAWCVEQWVGGRTQTDIARSLGYKGPAQINGYIMWFLKVWVDRKALYGQSNDTRRELATAALKTFVDRGMKIVLHPGPNRQVSNMEYAAARREHAFLLRCEAVTLKEIGRRMGISTQLAHHLALNGGYRLGHSMRRTIFAITNA